jgi:hypothetical protein
MPICRGGRQQEEPLGRYIVERWCSSLPASQQDRQCMYNVTQTLSPNHCCSGKARSITYSECVSVALVIQHAKRMRHIILSSVARIALPYFSTLSHKRYDFRKKLLNIKCVFWFYLQLLFEIFIILRGIHRDGIINVHRSLCKVPVIRVRFWYNLYFLERFAKNTQI